ncbi:amidohydrolase family protein [Sphingomonas tabacisoli]|uniref:Amidohydrolase family protein n=1 Tax=Sphingomonas tabacisoli TaxID=2249466 RepID=A0ABW4I1C3_9SPHN
MRIDVHSHFNPPRLAEAGAHHWSGWVPVHPPDLNTRVDAMDAAGIDLQLLWPYVQPNFPNLAKSRDFARFTNDIYRELGVRYRGRFSGWGSIPLPHVDAALAEIEYCLDDARFLGIGLGCSAAAIPLDDPQFDPIWAELDRRRAAVFIHPGQVRSGMPGATDYGLTLCLSSPMEIALASARLVLSGVSRRYPNVKFILATAGGMIPYVADSIVEAARRHGSDLGGIDVRAGLADFFYDTSVGKDPGKLSRTCDLCGTSHILFGTDAPYGDMASSVALVLDQFGVSDAEAILNRNAHSVLCHVDP